MKKVLAILLAVCLLFGVVAAMGVSAEEETVTIYFNLHEITQEQVSDLVTANHYLLAKDFKIVEGVGVLGLPEGGADVVFAGKELNEENAQKILPDYYKSEEAWLEHNAEDAAAEVVYCAKEIAEMEDMLTWTDAELQAYMDKNGYSGTVQDFRLYLAEEIPDYTGYMNCLAELVVFINGGADSIHNDIFDYNSYEEYKQEQIAYLPSEKAEFIERFSNIKEWDPDGEFTNIDNMDALFFIAKDGEGFDNCEGGGIPWDNVNNTWYYGCWYGGVSDDPGYTLCSFDSKELKAEDINVALKPEVDPESIQELTKDMLIVSTTIDGKTYIINDYEVAGFDKENGTVTLDFEGTEMTFSYKAKPEPQPEPQPEPSQPITPVPKTADNSAVIIFAVLALVSAAAVVVLKKKAN